MSRKKKKVYTCSVCGIRLYREAQMCGACLRKLQNNPREMPKSSQVDMTSQNLEPNNEEE